MKSKQLIALAVLTLCAGWAQAQTAGSILVRGGVTKLTPKVESGNLSAPAPAGTKTDVGADTQPTGGVTYMLTDNIAIDLPLGLGFKHELFGAGALAGVGKIGTINVLPVTLEMQYRFGGAKSQWRPYAKIGGTYAKFYGGEGSAALNALNPLNPIGGSTGVSSDAKFGFGYGLGLVVALGDTWSADVSIGKTMLKTTAKLSTGQTIEQTLNPAVFSLGVGMKFR